MRKKRILFVALSLWGGCMTVHGQKEWTLRECLDYALQRNIQLSRKAIAASSSHEDVLQSRGALLPSVSFSTNQNMSWRPFAESTINLTNGSMTTSKNTVSYNGSYGINANWTVWNGNRNLWAVRQNEVAEQIASLAVSEQANTIQEQIAQLYVQVLYEAEAVRVSGEIVKASEMQRDRAKAMVEAGSLARVDLVQLEAQVNQDLYSQAQAQGQLANYVLQLKQLLELDAIDLAEQNGEFAVKVSQEEGIGEPLGLTVQDVYQVALKNRPEMQQGLLNVLAADMALNSAHGGYMPTVSLTAGVGTNNSSGPHVPFFEQVKKNLSNSLGLTVSVPLFDGHQTRTNIRKAKYALQTSSLDLQEQQKNLYSTIETYWQNATTARSQYEYALANVKSMQESYDLVSEQFRLGLKNIVELTTGKNNLLQARQQLLQAKYTTLLNEALLKFYAGEELDF